MSPDPIPTTAPEITRADSLYKSFPDFSAWGELSPSDVDLWERFAANLKERRQSATPEALKASVEVAVRAAALDTGAIEGLYDVDRGFTMTVALQSLAWEQAIEERGAGVRELFEAQLEAYELVLDAVTRKLPLSEAWIRALHEKLCAPQKTYRVLTDLGWQEQELPKGQYKTRPNHVRLTDGTFHAYAPVDQVTTEMHRFLEQIRTPEFEAAHPVLQASYCHYALVVIHPFPDGNGRVARAVASTFYYRSQSIPLVIFANQRLAYLETLHTADLGDFKPVISFFWDRGIDTMQLVAESLMTSDAPRPENLATRVRTLSEGREGLSLEEIRGIAVRLLFEIAKQFGSQSRKLGPNLKLESFSTGLRQNIPVGFEPATILDAVGLRLKMTTDSFFTTCVIYIFLAKNAANPFRLRLVADGSSDVLDIRIEDAHPEISTVLEFRLNQWVQRRLTDMLSALEGQLGVGIQ